MNSKFVPAITKPCPLDLKIESNGEKNWHCSHCQLHVHNLSAMSPAEQKALFANRSGRVCVAYEKKADSVVVKPSTWLLWQQMLVPWRAAAAALALLFPFGFAATAATKPSSKPSATAVHSSGDGKTVVHCDSKSIGVFVLDRPLWRRILFFWER